MTIEHRLIPDDQLHEPKGVAGASSNTTYFANGSGSGNWAKVGSDKLLNTAGDGGFADLRVLTDGSNGFKLVRNSVHGVMAITENTNAKVMTAAADPTLRSTADYVLLTGTGAPLASEFLDGVTFSVDRLTVPITGLYAFDIGFQISTFPSSTAFVGFKFRVNNSGFPARSVILKSDSAANYGSSSSFGFLSLTAGDYVQMYVASSVSGNLVIRNADISLRLVKA